MPSCSAHRPQAEKCCADARGSDSESGSEDEQPGTQRKPIPQWARGQQLRTQLQSQYAVDPDQIFQQRVHTCDLSEVFARPGDRLPLPSV